MRTDAEVHFWKYDKAVLYPAIRDSRLMQQHYLPEQVEQSLHRNGIDGCIAVVAEKAEVETRFLCELAKTHSFIRGVVGWTDLNSAAAVNKMREFQGYGSIRGYQLTVQNEFPAEETMEFVLEHQYCIDISTALDTDYPALGRWLSAHPDQVFVLQNGGSPDIKKPDKNWENQIRDLAKNPQLYCKVSGFLEQGNARSWKPADFYPYLDLLFETFGPERLLYASNWPFILNAGMYVQWKSLLEKYTEPLTDEEQDQFFGENAVHCYKF